MERLRRALRGIDRAEAPGLPVGEALHPVALAAVVVLVVNDWVLKRWVPGVVTGKLSDLAGLAFAPVLLSALIGVALHAVARTGLRVDPSLSRRRLLLCCVATAAGFAAVKLSPTVAHAVADVIGHRARFYPDLTDLFTLPAVLVAWRIGRDEIRRVPLGRPTALHRTRRAAYPGLADVRWAGADPAAMLTLAAAIDAWDVATIDAALK